ncbi:MAG: HlyD family efflux transporter periplasmic adaptor subunit [Anaerolineales bacterium]
MKTEDAKPFHKKWQRNILDRKLGFPGRKTWLVLAGLVILAAGGYAAYRILSPSPAETTTTPQVQTAVARRGDLTVSASGVGKVVAASEISVGFDESGTLAELLVNVGDKVKSGQVIARLNTNQSQQDIALALAEAQLNVITAQQNLDDIYSSAQMDTANALKAVEDAQEALDDLQNTDLKIAQANQAVAEAEQAVKEAERAYYNMRATASQSMIAAAYADLVLAEDKLKDAQDKFNDYANKPDDNLTKANLQLRLSSAQSAYDKALQYYNALTGTGSELDQEKTAADLAAAQANLVVAQKEYERVKDGPSPGDIALAEAELATAQAKYETLKNGPDPAEIALAEATLADAQSKLAVAQEDQAVIDLVAPMDGTLLSIDASVGEAVGTGAIITLADLSQPVLEVYLDESDLDKVGVDYQVNVVFDALPDYSYTGHVTEVSPSLQSVANVTTMVAKVKLDADSFSKPQSLPVGSNAAVDVIAGQVQDAVLVPVEALREIDTGEYAVFVIENGEPRLRQVTVGLMDFTTAQIIAGLQAGEVVTTGVVETAQSGS